MDTKLIIIAVVAILIGIGIGIGIGYGIFDKKCPKQEECPAPEECPEQEECPECPAAEECPAPEECPELSGFKLGKSKGAERSVLELGNKVILNAMGKGSKPFKQYLKDKQLHKYEMPKTFEAANSFVDCSFDKMKVKKDGTFKLVDEEGNDIERDDAHKLCMLEAVPNTKTYKGIRDELRAACADEVFNSNFPNECADIPGSYSTFKNKLDNMATRRARRLTAVNEEVEEEVEQEVQEDEIEGMA